MIILQKLYFQTTKTRTLKSTRGNIYDRNGNVLASNELSYTVTLEDNGTYASNRLKNLSLNGEIIKIIRIIEENGDSINVEEIAEAVAEVVEKVTEKKLKEFTDAQKKEAQKIADAYAEVKKALGADFDSKNMGVDEIYTFGYETLANTALDKKMDAKTAFLLARDSKKATHKISDSGEAKPSNIQSILQEKY